MPGNGPQPGYVRSDTRLGNPAPGAAGPDRNGPAASLADSVLPATGGAGMIFIHNAECFLALSRPCR